MSEDKDKKQGDSNVKAGKKVLSGAKKPVKAKSAIKKTAKPASTKKVGGKGAKTAKPVATKKATPKKTAPKKVTIGKATGKATAKKPASKKAAPDKAAPDKAVEKKAKVEKVVAQTPVAQESAPKVVAVPVVANPAGAKPEGAKPEGAKPKKEEPAPLGLIVSSSPHLYGEQNIPKIMHNVILALVPAVLASLYIFGYRAALLLITCVVASLVTEAVFQRARKQAVTIYDGSAIITGLLLALTLPPSFPIHGAIMGSVFAIAIGKQIFGGLGFNIFNPALLGRAFLQATYPVLITTWTAPFAGGAVHAVSTATPLAMMKFEAHFAPLGSLFMGNVAGSLGETSAIAILIGGLFLRYKGYISWKLPLGFLGSIAFFATVFWLIDSTKYPSPFFHIFAGGAMLGAWFMITDMVTSPVTPKGQWIFVIGAGFLVVIIRLFGGLPEGVMYSILLMNAIVPLLNRWTRPKVFGEFSPKGK